MVLKYALIHVNSCERDNHHLTIDSSPQIPKLGNSLHCHANPKYKIKHLLKNGLKQLILRNYLYIAIVVLKIYSLWPWNSNQIIFID